MAVSVEQRSGAKQRQVVAWLTKDSKLLSILAPYRKLPEYKHGFFSSHLGTMADLCIEYFNRHGKAPKKGFHDLVGDHFQNVDREVGDAIEALEREILSLADDDRDLVHRLAQTEQTILHVAKQRLADEMDADSKKGRFKKDYIYPQRLTLVPDEGVVIGSRTQEEYDQIFAEDNVLVSYDGDLGIMLQGVFTASAFVSFIAREKIGKSWWLLDVCCRAIEAGYNAAYFAVGDLNQRDLDRRLMARYLKRPYVPKENGEFITNRKMVKIPHAIELNGIPQTRKRKYMQDDFLRPDRDGPRFNRLFEKQGLNNKLRTVVKPNNTYRVSDIQAVLEGWELRHGWKPEVVVVDYADVLLAPDNSSKDEYRHRIEAIWRELHAMSQKGYLIVTATQAAKFQKRSGRDDMLSVDNISEDKRKAGLVTTMIGINRFDDDRVALNCLVSRHTSFDPKRGVYVGSCFELGQPFVVSQFAGKR